MIAPLIKMGAQPSTTREEDFIQARQTCESMIQDCTREKNHLESRIKACEEERKQLERYYREVIEWGQQEIQQELLDYDLRQAQQQELQQDKQDVMEVVQLLIQ